MMGVRTTGAAVPYIVDRGWTLRIGRLRFDRWTRIYTGLPSAPSWPARPRSLVFNGRVALAASGLCMLAVVTTGVTAERAGARSSYALTVAVPPALHVAPQTIPALIPIARPASRPRPKAASLTEEAANLIMRSHPIVASRQPLILSLGVEEDAELVMTGPSSRARALKAALISGDMQEWADPAAAVRGFVVAGPVHDQSGRQCRAISVTTRSAVGGNTVEQRQDCLG